MDTCFLILTTPFGFIGLNPTLISSWFDVAWWAIPVLYATLVIWAGVELVRNKSLDVGPKIAFAILMVLAPFIGSILTILLVRTHSRPSNRGQAARAPGSSQQHVAP